MLYVCECHTALYGFKSEELVEYKRYQIIVDSSKEHFETYIRLSVCIVKVNKHVSIIKITITKRIPQQ